MSEGRDRANPLPEDVVRFLTDHFTTISELDVLLFIARRRRSFTSAEIGSQMRLGEYFSALVLGRLTAMGLLQRDGTTYALSQGAPEATLARVLDFHERYRVRMAQTIAAALPVQPGDTGAD